MSSISSRARRLESAISVCLLAILFLIAVMILIKQSEYDLSRYGIDTAAARLLSQQSKVNQAVGAVLTSLEPSGFETLSEIEAYSSGNLYEKINGKATFYTDSGFEQLFTRRFINQDDNSLWVELFVYDMAGIKNAFSVYSTQKRANTQMLSFAYPRYHYKTSNALYFVHGKYYIELTGSSESTKLHRAMVDITQTLCTDLDIDRDTKIAEMALFPKENLVSNSIKLYLKNTFGFENLTDTFVARYQIDTETVTAFLSRRATAQDARDLAESYYSFLISNDGIDRRTSFDDFSIASAKVVDLYGSTEIVFSNDRCVAGIHEADSVTAAEKVAAMLCARLTELQKQKND